MIRERYGEDAGRRLVLQFIYNFLWELHSTHFDASLFENVWTGFKTEDETAEWTHLAIAVLHNFEAAAERLDLGDGLSIRIREHDYLASVLGTWRVEDLEDELFHSTVSQYVILAEHKETKTPDNLIARQLPYRHQAAARDACLAVDRRR